MWFFFFMLYMEGETLGVGFPLFGGAKNSPLQISKNQRTMPVKQAWPTLKTCHWQVFLTLRSADADQGLCPWSPVTFFVKKVTQKA